MDDVQTHSILKNDKTPQNRGVVSHISSGISKLTEPMGSAVNSVFYLRQSSRTNLSNSMTVASAIDAAAITAIERSWWPEVSLLFATIAPYSISGVCRLGNQATYCIPASPIGSTQRV